MADYSIRSLADLSKEARGFFTQSIPGAIASVWANTFTVFAKVLALLNFEHELRRRWLFRQQFASTADLTWLVRHGFEVGLTMGAGAPAFGLVRLSVGVGAVVPSGLTLTREDGVTYTSVGGGVGTEAGLTVYVEADAAGAAGNLAAGAGLAVTLDPTLPVSLGGTATVVQADDGSGLSAGTDPEMLEAFRARVLARKRSPPQGGAGPDYAAWTAEALSVVRDVFVDAFQNDARSVWVQFTVTDQPNGIPTAAQVAAVQDYLSDPIRRPVTARVFVTASTPVAVPVVLQGVAPDTPEIRASIAVELAAEFTDRAAPGRPSAPFRFSRSWVGEAVSRAIGEDRHVLVSPPADIVFQAGQYPVLGTIGYTD